MSKIYFLKRKECVNCPAVKSMLDELNIKYKLIDADNISEDLQFKFLENQIFIYSTPSIVIEDDGKFELFSSGEIPKISKLKKEFGGS